MEKSRLLTTHRQPSETLRVRRRLLLAVLAGLAIPTWASAQSSDPDRVARTLGFVRAWWSNLMREPDPGDQEAKDRSEFVCPHPLTPNAWSSGGITIAWIGHSTFLMQLDGTTILTDPVFSDRVGVDLLGLATIGIRRYVPPPIRLRELPPLDLVLVSHAHMDHYDLPTLRKLRRDVPVIMARDTQEFADGIGFTRLQELDWGETTEVAGVRIEALPVRHWGRRYPWDRDRGYNALLITKGKRTVLFGGDTAYTDRLPAALSGRHVDVALLPIGGYNPYIYSHASPEQAWDLFRTIEADYFIPMHWRTFRLSREHPFEPYQRLAGAVNGSSRRIGLHTIGDTWSLPS